MRAALVDISVDAEPPLATLHLPASKSDQLAAGLARSLSCTCSRASSERPSCPVHVLIDHLLYLHAAFPSKCVEGVFELSLSGRT